MIEEAKPEEVQEPIVTAEQVWAEESAKRDKAESDTVVGAAPIESPQAEAEPEVEEPAKPELEPDPFEGVPEIVRTKLAKLDELEQANIRLSNDLRATQGRVGALQSEAAKAAKAAVAAKDAPTAAQIVEASKSKEKWDEAKKDWPEWAEAMEEYIASRIPAPTPGIDEDRVSTIVSERVEAARQEISKTINSDLVEDKHAGWKNTVKTEEFTKFFMAQPPEFQALANSPLARDTIRVLDKFEESKKPNVVSTVKDARNNKLAAAAAPAPGQSAPASRSIEDMTPEELWNYEAAQRAKTAAARGY